MMFRLESAPTASVHWTFVQGSGVIAGQTLPRAVSLRRPGSGHAGSTFVGSQLMANYETPDSYNGTGPSSDCWKHSNKIVVPVGSWSCAEWQFDGPTNTMRFWLDGAAVDTLTVMTTGSGCVNQPATYPWTAPTLRPPGPRLGVVPGRQRAHDLDRRRRHVEDPRRLPDALAMRDGAR